MADLNNYYCQRNKRYLEEPLGKGVGGSTIYNFGCYFVSLCRQLDVDPIKFNTLLLKYDLWDNENYIKVSELSAKLPTLFKSYKMQDSFSMDEFGAWCSDKNIIAVCKVSALAIGGTGTHFVGEEKRDGANAIIFDPYYGDIIKVADRYGKYGNIKSMRIFYLQDNWKEELNKLLGTNQSSTINEGNNMADELMQITKADFNKLRKNSETLDAIASLLGLAKDLDANNYLEAIKSRTKTVTEIKEVEVPVEVVKEVHAVDIDKYEDNGIRIEEQITPNMKRITNYTRKA